MNALQMQNKIEAALVEGDLSKLSAEERLSYFHKVCESVGVNPLTRPFEYLRLNGKLVLYARKDATDQLRKIHGVSITKLETEIVNDICLVTACGRDKHGKEDSEVGAVDVKGLTGEKLANAMMKAATKAKRRLTLSMCGLGLLDESEVDSIPDAKKEPLPAQGNVAPPLAIAQSEAQQIEAVKDEGLGAYVITFGKAFKDKRLDQIGQHDLDNWVNYLRDESERQNKPLTGQYLEAVEAAEAYLKTREFERAK